MKKKISYVRAGPFSLFRELPTGNTCGCVARMTATQGVPTRSRKR